MQEKNMLTIILKGTRPLMPIKEDIFREIWWRKGAKVIINPKWNEAMKQVTTPFVCLVEPDARLSRNYLINFKHQDSVLLSPKQGGYVKLAMVSPSVVMDSTGSQIFSYGLDRQTVRPVDRRSDSSYHVQVGFVPGAVMRYSAVKDFPHSWDEPNLVKLSTQVSCHIWDNNNRVKVNPTVVYHSAATNLSSTIVYDFSEKIRQIFAKEGI